MAQVAGTPEGRRLTGIPERPDAVGRRSIGTFSAINPDDLTIEAISGSVEPRWGRSILVSIVVGWWKQEQYTTLPEVRITNPRGESFVLSVLDTWELATAEADRLINELYGNGVQAFCEKYGLPDEFGK